jgi:hypothetical protein
MFSHFRCRIDGPSEIEKAIRKAIEESFGPESSDSPSRSGWPSSGAMGSSHGSKYDPQDQATPELQRLSASSNRSSPSTAHEFHETTGMGVGRF